MFRRPPRLRRNTEEDDDDEGGGDPLPIVGSGTSSSDSSRDGAAITIIISVVDAQYAPCACSPLGKVSAVSRPYAPNGAPVFTTYTYDASGRTLSVTLPDGSVTKTVYQGNTTTITDPVGVANPAAGKWKKQTTDAMGNLTLVTEPNPAGGADWTTSYSYNSLNQLTGVSIPRQGPNGMYAQPRTFVWSGSDLVTETTPEAGTVTYQYDAAHHVTQRTDAKQQQTQYSYDPYGRLTQVRHYILNGGVLQEQVNQRVDYAYDTPADSSFQNTWCRLTAVQFHNENAGSIEQFSYQYSYSTAGRVTKQRLQMLPRGSDYNATSNSSVSIGTSGRTFQTQAGLPYCSTSQHNYRIRVAAAASPSNYVEGVCSSYTGTTLVVMVDTVSGPGVFNAWNITYAGSLAGVNLDVAYTWDNEGKMTSQQYPGDDAAHTYNYQFDTMARPASMGITGAPSIATATWAGTGELLSFNGDTRTYNNLGQLTHITGPGMYVNGVWTNLMDMRYEYTAGQNNGRVAQTIDGIKGETVNYTYDAVNRLIQAATTDATWGQGFTYDGWGNLTGKTQVANKGAVPLYSASIDPTTNGGPNPATVPTGYTDNNDVENRPLAAAGGRVSYDGSGKRVFWTGTTSYQSGRDWVTRTVCEIYL